LFVGRESKNRKVSLFALIGLMVLLSGCEAKLDLSGVAASTAEPVMRYDHFQAAAKSAGAVIVIANRGVMLVSRDKGQSWNRQSLPGSSPISFPTLLDIDVCPDDRFVVLDADRKVWISDANGENWVSKTIPTEEEVLDLTCDHNGALWVVGSFTLIMGSHDGGESWTDKSIAEDAMFSRVQFLDRNHGIVTGEFGTVYKTADGGNSWQAANQIPNEFYPMASLFVSVEKTAAGTGTGRKAAPPHRSIPYFPLAGPYMPSESRAPSSHCQEIAGKWQKATSALVICGRHWRWTVSSFWLPVVGD